VGLINSKTKKIVYNFDFGGKRMKVENFLQGWLRHRLVLHELVELIDNQHVNFKPWDKALSMGTLAVHTASATDMFVKAVKNGVFAPPRTKNEFQTMDEVRDIIFQLTEVTKEDLLSLTDDQLEKELNFNNYIGKGSLWISMAKDHEIHHKGQLFTYARMVGVDNLPFFVKKLETQ
jgi:uncharacterized damage-inducible protein DinB